MKHPALARVFSVVLAILSLIMLLNAAFGFSKASVELQDSLSKYQRLEDKTAEYESLTAQLENTISYDEAYAALEEMQTEHDSDASQHRTDLATHTATMGGYTMAAQLINEGKAELAEAKVELEDSKKLLETQEAQFNQASAEFEAQKPMLEAAISTSKEGAAYFTAASANADSAMKKIDDAQSTRPSKPETLGEEATEEEREAYEAELARYNTDYEAWETGVKLGIASDLADMAANATTGAVIMNGITESLPDDMTGGAGSASMDMSSLDFSTMSVDAIYAALGQMKAGFNQAAATPTTLQASLNAAQAQITAGAKAIADAKTQILAGEATIKRTEQELQHQLEVLWYNMGQLEDESSDLESTKQRLDQEAETIAKQLVSVEEQKSLEQKWRSARIILMKEEGIKQAVDAGADLADSAKTYVQSGRDTAQRRYALMCLTYALAVAGGALGLVCIPGSFEKLKSRFMLLAPTALCLACALTAEGLSICLNNAQMYTAIFVAVAAMLHLIFTIPKNKIAT